MSTPPDDGADYTDPPAGGSTPPRRGGDPSQGTGSGGTAVPPPLPPTTTSTAAEGPTGTPAQPGGPDPSAQRDPSAPLREDSTGIDSALGTSASGGPQLDSPVHQSATTTRYLAHHQFSSDTEKDFYNFTESDYRHNQEFAKKAGAKDAYSLLNDDFNTGVDGVSENDRARIVAGVLDPAKLAAATKAHTDNASDLKRFGQQVAGGDTKAVSTADQVLAYGEAGLQFFRWFYRAYHLYTGGGETIEDLEKGYHAEQGMSFADYVADAALLASISQGIDDEAWKVSNAAARLQSSWQGQAASNFGAKMQVLTSGAGTVKQDLAVVGADIGALVQGLEQVVIAKAEAVNQLFLAQLPDRIDGGIAYTFATVATGKGEDPQRRVILGLLGMDMTGRHEFWAGDAGNDWSSGDSLNDDSRKAADQAAADWCNEVLVPEYEARQNALNTINAKTTQLIQRGFAEFTKQLQNIADPFRAMDSARGTAPVGTAGGSGSGSSGSGSSGSAGSGGGGGIPSVGGGGPAGAVPGGAGPGGGAGLGAPHIPDTTPTVPAGLTTPQGGSTLTGLPGSPGAAPTATGPAGLPGGLPAGDPTGGATRPAGLPPGATWIPSGVPLPSGWRQDPTTGEALPKGWSVDPSTGLPSATNGGGPPTGAAGAGLLDPKQDIHHNKDGSVSLGRDRGLTISPEHGRRGVFTLRDTGPDGVEHTYRVHFDDHGRPVVTEQPTSSNGPGAGGLPSAGTAPQQLTGVGGAGGSGGGAGVGSAAGAGNFGGTGVPRGPAGAAAAQHTGPPLADGTHVGADNTTTNAMTGSDPAATATPVAGSAPDGQGSAQHGGGFGGVPLGGGGARGAGGGQEQESARRYPQRGDVVGEEELEQWQRMGPVIGEQ